MVGLIEALGLTTTSTTEGLLATLADPANRDAIDAAVDDQTTHFDMIGLQLGYCYVDGALARDGDPPPPIADPRRFEPDAAVGTRLPHGWLDDGRSTLDLVDVGTLTLLSVGGHDEWASAVAGTDAPVRHVRVGLDTQVNDKWTARCGLGADGALLVRPDQHIAWRSDTLDAQGPQGLAEAIGRILGR